MGPCDIDQPLVERARNGDKRAFDGLVLRYQHKIQSVIGQYVRDPSDAADVSQDAFLRAYRAMPAFRGDSAFYTWMYRIAVNTAKNYLIARARRPPSEDIDSGEAEQFEGATGLKDLRTPERVLMAVELESTITHALAALPEDLRLPITLREMRGLSYCEIARLMDCPVGTVRSRIFRAREAINRRVQPFL